MMRLCRAHPLHQDRLILTLSSMFTVPNLFGAWHRTMATMTPQPPPVISNDDDDGAHPQLCMTAKMISSPLPSLAYWCQPSKWVFLFLFLFFSSQLQQCDDIDATDTSTVAPTANSHYHQPQCRAMTVTTPSPAPPSSWRCPPHCTNWSSFSPQQAMHCIPWIWSD